MIPIIDVIYGVTATKFDRIVNDLRSTMQRAADATTENASEWKAAKDAGVNNKALKTCLSLDRMSDDKRRDFLRAFDAYRNHYFTHWDNQPDMLDAEAAPEEAESQVDTADSVEQIEGEGEQPLAAQAPDEAKTDIPAADWGDDKAVEGSATGAVAAFNDGKSSGRRGEPEEGNPHGPRTAVGKSWRKGWQVGAAELVKIGQEGADARRAGKGMETAPYISDTDPAGAKAWAVGWYKVNRELTAAETAKPVPGATEIDGVVYLSGATH